SAGTNEVPVPGGDRHRNGRRRDADADQHECEIARSDTGFPRPRASSRSPESPGLHRRRKLASPANRQHEQRERLPEKPSDSASIADPPGPASKFKRLPVVEE